MAHKEYASLSGRVRVAAGPCDTHNHTCIRDIENVTVRNASSPFLFEYRAEAFPGAFLVGL